MAEISESAPLQEHSEAGTGLPVGCGLDAYVLNDLLRAAAHPLLAHAEPPGPTHAAECVATA